jgi:hypothetical protein
LSARFQLYWGNDSTSVDLSWCRYFLFKACIFRGDTNCRQISYCATPSLLEISVTICEIFFRSILDRNAWNLGICALNH